MRRYLAVVTSMGLGLMAATESCAGQPGEPDPRNVSPSGTSIDPALLDPIQHRTKGILAAERDAYYAVLNHARQADDQAQTSAAGTFLRRRHAASPFRDRSSGEFPLFVDMFQHPEAYTGKPVRLNGYLRKLVAYPAGENDYGIDTLYEGWLFTEDSQGHPAVVVCTSIPARMRPFIGADLINHVEVTGYFFKLYGYDAQDATRLAPLILAERMQWNPPPEAGTSLPVRLILFGIPAAVILLLIGMVTRSALKDRELHRRRVKGDANADEPDFSALATETNDSETP